MKKLVFYCTITLLALTGCQSTESKVPLKPKTASTTTQVSHTTNSAQKNSSTSSKRRSTNQQTAQSTHAIKATVTSTNKPTAKKTADLNDYSALEIEYARVWLSAKGDHLINSEYNGVPELNIHKITKGTPIHPSDSESAHYPTDMVRLAGSSLSDGSVIYKSNHNGTVTIYPIPLKWDKNWDSAKIKQSTSDMLKQGKDLVVDVGNPEKVIQLIELEIIH